MKDKKLEVIYKGIDEIIPYINNPRYNQAAIDKVAASIAEFGFKVPIVIDRDNVIVTGHTRREAAKKLNIEQIPCIYADDLTPAQVKAFRLADNKTSEFSYWDTELLKIELDALKELEYDVNMTDFGFSDLEDIDIDSFFEETEPQEPQEAKEEKEIKCPHCGMYFKVDK